MPKSLVLHVPHDPGIGLTLVCAVPMSTNSEALAFSHYRPDASPEQQRCRVPIVDAQLLARGVQCSSFCATPRH
jgi:hypothetical protein